MTQQTQVSADSGWTDTVITLLHITSHYFIYLSYMTKRISADIGSIDIVMTLCYITSHSFTLWLQITSHYLIYSLHMTQRISADCGSIDTVITLLYLTSHYFTLFNLRITHDLTDIGRCWLDRHGFLQITVHDNMIWFMIQNSVLPKFYTSFAPNVSIELKLLEITWRYFILNYLTLLYTIRITSNAFKLLQITSNYLHNMIHYFVQGIQHVFNLEFTQMTSHCSKFLQITAHDNMIWIIT